MRKLLASTAVLLLALTGAADAGLRFEPCGKGGFECATLKAPLDYDEPDGSKIEIAVTRLPAADPRRSLGPLFVNYGGPGANAGGITRQIGRGLFGAYTRRFDLIGLDPRGTGDSQPTLDCAVDQAEEGIYRRPFARPEPVPAERQLRLAERYADRCARRNAKIAAHVSTANVARDMDLARRKLGESEISFFGFSYGTMLGATYAAMFGEHLRAAVLDGALNPDAYLSDPVAALATQTAAFEAALQRYFGACRAARRFCGWTRGADPEKAYDRLVARADRKPIPARRRGVTQGHRAPVTGDDINFAVAGELYAKQLWPELTQALGQARGGDGSLIRSLVDASDGRRRDGYFDPATDRYFMIGAAEQQYGTDPQVILDLEDDNARAFPHFFFNSGYAQLPYTFYEARDQDVFLDPFRLAKRTPRVLVVGTTFDPATPYSEAAALTRTLGRARLLTMRGDGHTAYGGNSPCIDRHVDRYVLRGRLPRRGTRCRQDVPFGPLGRSFASASAGGVERAAPVARLGVPFKAAR